MTKKDTIEIKIESNFKDIQKELLEVADKAKNKKKILRALSRTILNYIEDNFETEGENSGEKWQDWSEDYAEARKKIGRGEGQILTLEGKLKESIKRRIIGDTSVEVGTNVVYAAIHNFGYDDDITRKTKKGTTTYHLKMPKRTFMEFTPDLERLLADELWAELKIDEVERELDVREKFLRGEG